MLDMRSEWYADEAGNAWSQADWDEYKEFPDQCEEARSNWNEFVNMVAVGEMSFDGKVFRDNEIVPKSGRDRADLGGGTVRKEEVRTEIGARSVTDAVNRNDLDGIIVRGNSGKIPNNDDTAIAVDSYASDRAIGVDSYASGMSAEEQRFHQSNFVPGRRKGSKNKKPSVRIALKVMKIILAGSMKISEAAVLQRMRRKGLDVKQVKDYIVMIKEFC